MGGIAPDAERLDAYHFYDRDWNSYEELYEDFEWEVPEKFNVAAYACDRWASEKGRVALFAEDSDGTERTYTFWELQTVTNRLANYLRARGVERGDRVGVNLPQKPETVMAHLAIWKLGAVSVPLSTLFGTDAIRYRLNDCSVTACFVDASNVDTLRAVAGDVDSLSTVLTVGDGRQDGDETDFWAALEGQSREFDTVETDAEDDAMIAYTSGTTGDPKGVRHAHRVLLGNLPYFVTTFCNMDVDDADVFWTHAEWGWFGPMFALVLPPLFYGKPVVAYHRDGPFEPEKPLEILEKYGVTVGLLLPTAIRMMMQVEDPAERFDLTEVRVVMTGGEEVGENVVDWISTVFDDAPVHEGYGQIEANGIVGKCTKLGVDRRETSGKALLGHDVRILDPDTDEPVDECGTVGEISVQYEDNPICMKEYWNLPEKTAEKVRNGRLCTEDLGSMDADGYLTYHSRKDDVIISSGRRIGPGEIEDSLTGHDAVMEAGVIGVPDDERGEIPKAYVALADGYGPSGEIETELQTHAQDALARYEYPHEIEFVDDLPKTVTGKVRRVDLRRREGLDGE